MIKISILKDSSGFIKQFCVEGHAGYDKYGKDIICAAASVTAYTAVGALEDLAGIKNCHTERDGYFICRIPHDITDEQKQTAKVILDTTLIGFKQIELTYTKFITVEEKEEV